MKLVRALQTRARPRWRLSLPLLSMSGKGGGRKGNIRKRKADSSDEERAGGGDKAGGEGVNAVAPPPAGAAGGTGAMKAKAAAKKDKGLAKGLSFGGDGDVIDGEEDETFVLKKKKPKVENPPRPPRPAPPRPCSSCCASRRRRALPTADRDLSIRQFSQERKDAAVAFKKGAEGDGKAASMGSYYSGGSYTDADMAALSKNAKSIGGKLATVPVSETSAMGGVSAAMDGTSQAHELVPSSRTLACRGSITKNCTIVSGWPDQTLVSLCFCVIACMVAVEGKKLRKKERSGTDMDAPVKIKGLSWAPKHDDDEVITSSDTSHHPARTHAGCLSCTMSITPSSSRAPQLPRPLMPLGISHI